MNINDIIVDVMANTTNEEGKNTCKRLPPR